MRQLAQYQDGRLELQEVPAPVPPPGGILVQTSCSVISPGTEKMKVEQARMSLLQKARARPDQVKKVLDTARTLGWKSALEKVRNRLESPTPLGYSAAGTVIAVDPLNTRFRVGDRVACGGAECAFHAETIAVPDLLAARIPDGVADWQAAYTTLAAISMQAVRQSGAQLGDRVLVLGQGLVGLLATSLLRASGARVLAADYVQDRLNTALAMGAERVINPGQSSIAEAVRDWTDGDGVDAVLLCVGGKGSDAADVAIASLRDRGVMVIVGIYDAELSWKTAYMKDIQVRYSRSYGPGRYDPQYEWGGQDYPLGYVRWTENRQFEACLQLMKTGQLDLAPVTSRRATFASAIDVYSDLMKPGNTDIGVVLEYARSPGVPSSTGILPVESEAGILPAKDSGRMPEPQATGRMPELQQEPQARMPVLPDSGKMPELLGAPVPQDSQRLFIPFDPDKKTDKTQRNLPHWEQSDITQFVTFRLADSLPDERLKTWLKERENWLADHPKPWDYETEELYHRLFSERMETWLDQGHGSCALARPEVAEIVEKALRHFDGERYILDEYVIMPNHVHVLVKCLGEHSLSEVMHSWKSFTGREIKRLLGLSDAAPFWQSERFDHAVRHSAALKIKRRYIADNPQEAGLKSGQGYRCGSGIGVLVQERSPSSTGILPVESESGILPANHSGRMPEPQATGRMPVLHQETQARMPVPQDSGRMPELHQEPQARMPEPQATGKMPVLQDSGRMPELRGTPERRLHVIGAGNFARTMLLPHLKGTLEFDTVVNATGLSARHVKEKFGFARAETDAAKVFEGSGSGSGSGGAVLIATRHHLHAPLVLQGLQAGRHVFVEKPLCLTPKELTEIDAAVASTEQGSVTVGFNRRFAPASVELQKVLKAVPGPKTLAFHVFAGPLAPDHWYANVAESGGRILGEACHFFDYACFLLGKPVRVMATTTGRQDVPDAVNAQIEFENGSSAQIIYSAQGDSSFPKESFRVFGAGVVAECENFQKLTIHRSRKRKAHAYASKGHAEEMQAWAAYVKGDGRAPLPYEEARQSMRLTFAVLESLRQGAAVTL